LAVVEQVSAAVEQVSAAVEQASVAVGSEEAASEEECSASVVLGVFHYRTMAVLQAHRTRTWEVA
jgi:hypothetical protein